MIDENGDVMRTFSDYTADMQIQFVQLPIGADHPWAGKQISELSVLKGMLIALIRRGDETLAPRGSTRIEAGDIVVLAAEGFADHQGTLLKEIPITPDHRWCGKKLSEAKFYKKTVVVMIRRGGQVLIPDGNTRMEAGDHAVVYSQQG